MTASVLINNYNYARYLPDALRSVVAQTRSAHEIIVVDDGSNDESLAVLDSMRSFIPNLRIYAQPNGGQLAAMRAGIRQATGDWCFFLDADDAWEPNHLEIAAQALATTPAAGVWYSGHKETAGPPLYHSKWPSGPGGPFAAIVSATGVRIGTITSTIALKTDLAREIADFPAELDADWRIRADDVLLFGAAFAGAIFYYSPQPTVRYRIHGNNHYANQIGQEAKKSREEIYNRNREKLFEICRTLYGLDPACHLKLLCHELASYPAAHRSHEALRRYRRAIRRMKAPFPAKLQAYLSTYG